MEDYSHLVEAVNKNQGALVVTMGKLRDVHKAGKLGTTVVTNISRALKNAGLDHAPTELSTSQWDCALIYRQGNAIAQVVGAIQNIDGDSASILKNLVGAEGGDRKTIERIRELVCD